MLRAEVTVEKSGLQPREKETEPNISCVWTWSTSAEQVSNQSDTVDLMWRLSQVFCFVYKSQTFSSLVFSPPVAFGLFLPTTDCFLLGLNFHFPPLCPADFKRLSQRTIANKYWQLFRPQFEYLICWICFVRAQVVSHSSSQMFVILILPSSVAKLKLSTQKQTQKITFKYCWT